MTGTPEEEEITWDDLPVGTVLVGTVLGGGVGCHIKWGLERGYCRLSSGRFSAHDGKGMHGPHQFTKKDWDEVTFMPKEFLE